MAFIRATFFFADIGGTGWTETYYSNKANATVALPAANDLAVLRTPLLGTTARLIKIRVSDDDKARDSLALNLPAANAVTNIPGADAADPSFVCLLITMRSGSTARRSLALRGIPDELDVRSGQIVVPPGWGPRFVEFANKIKTDGWCIRRKNPLAIGFAVEAINQAVDGTVAVTTTLAHGLAPGDQVTFKGFKGATAINGTTTVFAVATDKIFSIKMNTILPPVTLMGRVFPKDLELKAIDSVIPERISHRITGRPFFLPRGRRKARPRA